MAEFTNAPGAWKPKAGETCLRPLQGGDAQKVVVVATTDSQAWIVPAWKTFDPMYRGFAVFLTELRPLAAEPPTPDTLYDKMKKRLTEMGNSAPYAGVDRNQVLAETCRTLLKDLETYAKEIP